MLSSLTESSQLRSSQDGVYGPCDAVPEDEPCVQCRPVRGVPEPGADPPTHRKLFLRNTDDGWPGVLATEEALSSHQLRQTSQNLFHGLDGPPDLKPQHYEAAHGKAFLAILSLPSSYPG